jgi:hypothetical protein
LRNLFRFTLVFSFVFLLLNASAQSNMQSNAVSRIKQAEDAQSSSAKNKWMRVPTAPEKQTDLATIDERHLRDLFWDSLIGAKVPLSQPDAHPPGLREVDAPSRRARVPKDR